MATDGGKRAERPATSGSEAKQPEAKQPDAKQAESKQPDAKPGAKGPRNAARTTNGNGNGEGDGARLPYEQARDQLTELVKRLEAGGLTLEQSLELWERGERLAAICEEWLEGARARLAAAMAQRSDNGPAPGTPF
jgi:exodeoxyribonuclease VII small subunit